MKEIFGVGNILKDGSESKVKTLPPIEDLQRGIIHAHHRADFIRYSAYDAEGTWLLHEALDKGKERESLPLRPMLGMKRSRLADVSNAQSFAKWRGWSAPMALGFTRCESTLTASWSPLVRL